MTDAIFDHSGSSFDTFLAEEDLLDEAEASAIQRLIAWQLAEAMRAQGVSRDAMAERMGTSRLRLDRLLDADGREVHWATLTRAARVMGKMLRVEVVDAV